MGRLVQIYGPIAFPLAFAVFWLAITSALAVMSGWFGLMQQYPDRPEQPLLRLRGQSGSMGAMAVRFGGLLRLEVCPSGLRVGMMRLFGPFCRDFFVPWSEIKVERRSWLFVPLVDLNFGSVGAGRLSVRALTADRLAAAAGPLWPERGPIAAPSPARIGGGIFAVWALQTGLVSAFLLVGPAFLTPHRPGPPVWMAIGLPAAAFGVIALVRFALQSRT